MHFKYSDRLEGHSLCTQPVLDKWDVSEFYWFPSSSLWIMTEKRHNYYDKRAIL